MTESCATEGPTGVGGGTQPTTGDIIANHAHRIVIVGAETALPVLQAPMRSPFLTRLVRRFKTLAAGRFVKGKPTVTSDESMRTPDYAASLQFFALSKFTTPCVRDPARRRSCTSSRYRERSQSGTKESEGKIESGYLPSFRPTSFVWTLVIGTWIVFVSCFLVIGY